MSLGETAELRIEAEWAYGRKGLEGKYPFHKIKLVLLQCTLQKCLGMCGVHACVWCACVRVPNDLYILCASLHTVINTFNPFNIFIVY